MIISAFIALLLMGRADAAQSPPDDYSLEQQGTGAATDPAESCLFSAASASSVAPRVTVQKDRIEIRDDAGQIKNTIERVDDPTTKTETHFIPDKTGKVLGVQITKGYNPKTESWTDGEYYILDVNGNKKLDIPKFADATHPSPSPSGDYAVGWPGPDTPGGPPIFYDATGIRNKWAHGFSGEGWPKGYPTNDVSFSSDGRYVAVLAGMVGGSENVMIVYDDHGNQLFDVKEDIKAVVFSPDSSRVAFYSITNKAATLVDLKGNLLWKSSQSMLPRQFSADGRSLLVENSDSIGVLKTETGDLVWRWDATEQNLSGRSRHSTAGLWGDGFLLMDPTATPSFHRILVTAATLKRVPVKPGRPQQRVVSEKDHVLIFDEKGHLLHWEDFTGGSLKIPNTIMRVSKDGNAIALSFNEGIKFFSMKHR